MSSKKNSDRVISPDLRKRYHSRLVQQSKQMETLFRQLDVRPLDRNLLEDLHLIIHTIAGSAKFFGFEEISDTAGEFESFIIDLMSKDIDRLERKQWESNFHELYGKFKIAIDLEIINN